MPNGIPLTIGGQPSILGAFASGREFRRGIEQEQAEAARQARLLEFSTSLILPNT